MIATRQAIVIDILTVLFACLLLSSCQGQDLPKRANTILKDTSNASSTSYVDPLFYIEGQLCQHLRRIYQDRRGHFWLGTNVYGLMHYRGDSLEHFNKKTGFPHGRITAILEDSTGNVWFGAYGGLSRYDGQSFTHFSEEAGLRNTSVWSVIIDRDGLFWVGTEEGVYQFDGRIFNPFPIPKASVQDTTTILAYDRISCILQDRQGHLWFGTDGFGICRYDGHDFSHFTKANGLCDNNIAYLLEDQQGHIWIGTMYGGISRYDGQSFTNFSQNGLVEGVEAYGIYEDSAGHIWFSSEGYGVYRYDGQSFTRFHKKEGLNSDGIQCVFEDQQGRIWLGGWGGLFGYDGQSFFSVTKDSLVHFLK